MIQPTHLDAATIAARREAGLWTDSFVDTALAAHAVATPDSQAVVDGDTRYNYGELDTLIRRTAAGLLRRGIGRGDVVAWQLPNWVEAIIVHHAALRIGAVSNPIIPIYREREVAFILKQSRAAIFFVPGAFRGFDYAAMIQGLRPDLPDLGHVVVVRGHHSDGGGFADFCVAADADATAQAGSGHSPNDIALLLYTSGTTSDPKGVLHTHNTLDYENRSIIDLFGLAGSDVVFMPSPLGHITGVLYGLHLPFMLGSGVVLQDIWDAGAALRLIADNRCAFSLAATPFLHGLVHHPDRQNYDLSSIRVFACGGADVPPALIIEAERTLDCLATRIYGSSEFPTLSSGSAGDTLAMRAQTDGRPIGAAEARVVNEDGQSLGAGETGELLVRGPEMFVGYLDASLNDAAFDPEGWFHTGDFATIDANGYVRITGRLKDIIIRGGENISAKEIEDLLIEHPLVADAAVVGMPDPVLVERNCAYVVPKGSAAPSLEELVSFLRSKKMANQKLPERLEIIAELPRTASGKVQKFKLRDDIRHKLKIKEDVGGRSDRLSE